MNRAALLFIVVATVLVFVFVGCGPSGETDRNGLSTPPNDTTAQSQAAGFETRTDTVSAQGTKQRVESSTQFNSSSGQFMVQIGSFTDAQNASNVQLLARQRYKLPVVNDYNAARHQYQIRIGFFEKEQSANEFLRKLRSDYPKDYKDGWVVQINK